MQNQLKNITVSLLALLSLNTMKAQDSIKSKELIISKPVTAGSRVLIDQLDRKIIIKASPDNNIKLATTVFYTGENTVTDPEWWDYINIKVKELTGLVSIQPVREYDGRWGLVKTKAMISTNGRENIPVEIERQDFIRKTVASASYYDYDAKPGVGTDVAQFDSAGKWVNRNANIRRELVIYLPASTSLKIESRFGDIVIETNLSDLNVVIDHSSLTMPDASKLVLRSNYGHITSGNIKDANIDITGGKWSGKKVDKINIMSRSSSVDLGSVLDATIDSGDDQYDIDEIKSVHGRKNFGNLRILQLTGSLDITGNSAHIKIRDMTTAVSLIKITDQFADLKLPLTNLKNYTVGFEGTRTKVYAPFNLPEKKDAFTTNSGNLKGAHTAFQLNCSNCTVEFQ